MSGERLVGQMPSFAMAWTDLLTDQTISDGAVRLYLLIESRCRPDKPIAWPGQETLGAELGCSVDTVKRRLDELLAAGWIRLDRRGARRTNVYQVLMPSIGDSANLRSLYGVRKRAASVEKKMKLKANGERRDYDNEPPSLEYLHEKFGVEI